MQNGAKVLLVLLLITSSLVIVNKPAWASAQDSWTPKASMQEARASLGTTVVNGKVYAIGGYNAATSQSQSTVVGTNEEYDPSANTWIHKSPMLTPRSHFGIAVYENKIYCIGGYANSSVTAVNEVYDPAKDTWEIKASMPTARWGLKANIVDGKIYLIGGLPENLSSPKGNSNLNEVYDPATDSWSTKTPIPTAICFYASAVFEDKIYVLGGQSAIAENLNQIFDSTTDTWTLGMSLPKGLYYAAVAVTTGVNAPKRIYLIGGTGAGVPDGINQAYDPVTDSWTVGSSMPTSRINLAVAIVNDTLYAVGGYYWPTIGPTAPCAMNEQYTPMGYKTNSATPPPTNSPELSPSPSIPEFPSFLILLIPMGAILFSAIAYKKRRLNH